MTPRDRRLDKIEVDLRLASLRRAGPSPDMDVILSVEELEAIIQDRREHPRPVRKWERGEPLTTDYYSVEELQEILDFEKEHPLGGDHQ